jgi:hypothetical protein
MNVGVRFSAPVFEHWGAIGRERDVPAVEAVIELGEISPLVRPAALGPSQRTLGD